MTVPKSCATILSTCSCFPDHDQCPIRFEQLVGNCQCLTAKLVRWICVKYFDAARIWCHITEEDIIRVSRKGGRLNRIRKQQRLKQWSCGKNNSFWPFVLSLVSLLEYSIETHLVEEYWHWVVEGLWVEEDSDRDQQQSRLYKKEKKPDMRWMWDKLPTESDRFLLFRLLARFASHLFELTWSNSFGCKHGPWPGTTPEINHTITRLKDSHLIINLFQFKYRTSRIAKHNKKAIFEVRVSIVSSSSKVSSQSTQSLRWWLSCLVLLTLVVLPVDSNSRRPYDDATW